MDNSFPYILLFVGLWFRLVINMLAIHGLHQKAMAMGFDSERTSRVSWIFITVGLLWVLQQWLV